MISAGNEPEAGPSSRPQGPRYGGPAEDAPVRQLQVDDIQVEYHYSAKRPAAVYAFEDFKRNFTGPRRRPDDQPWHPFKSRTDFEFAELVHEAHLSNRQVKRLLAIIDKISDKKDRFTFKTADDVDRAWAKAKLRYPSVRDCEMFTCW